MLLAELIHNLTLEEKEYIKTKLKTKNTKRAIQLQEVFHLIVQDRQVQLEKHFKDPDFIKNIATWQNILYRYILEHLSISHRNKKQEDALVIAQQYRLQIIFLFKKKLTKLALKEINKAKKHAQKSELLLELLQLELLKKQNILTEEYHQITPYINDQKQTAYDILESLKLELLLSDFYEKIYLAQRNRQTATFLSSKEGLRDEIKQLFQSYSHIKNKTFTSYFYYHNVLYFLELYLHRNPKQAYQHLKALITLFEKNEDRKTRFQTRYLNTLNNYFNACFKNKDLTAMATTLEELAAIVPANNVTALKRLHHLHYYKLLYFLIQKQYEHIEKMEADVEKGLERYEHILPPSRAIVIKYNIAIALLLQKSKRTAHWINKILNSARRNSQIRKDAVIKTYLLELLEQYDQQQYIRLREYARNYIRRLQRNGLNESVEAAITRTLIIATKLEGNRSAQIDLFEDLRKKIEKEVGVEEFIDWINYRFLQ